MTVAAEILSELYAGNGSTTVFAYRFKIFAASEIVVRLINIATGAAIVQTLTTHYTVSGVDEDEGGNVTMLAAPASGYTLDLRPVYVIRQPTSLTNQGRFLPEIHETAFDRVTLFTQYLKRLVQRCLHTDEGDPITDLTLGSVDNRKGRYLFFHAVTGAIEYAANIVTTTLSQSSIGALLYPQTAAEAAAGVTPTNYAYAPGYLRRYGGVGDGSTAADAAVASAIAQAAQSGGTSVLIDAGTYRLTADVTVAAGIVLDFLAGLLTVDSGKTLTINGTVRAGLRQVFTGAGTVVFGANSRQESVHPEWFGAAPGGSAATNRPAIKRAMNAHSTVDFANGMYDVDATLRYNDNQVLRFPSRAAGIRANITSAVLKAEDAENTRRFRLQIYGGKIDGTSRSNVGSIGLDLFAVTMAKIYGTEIANVETGVRCAGQVGPPELGCYYNEFYGVDILTVVTGFSQGTQANDNKVFGGRVNDSTIGTDDNNNSGNGYYGLAIEVFATGHRNSNTTVSQFARYVGSRLENLPTAGTGILIGATAQDTYVESPQTIGLTTDISDAGLRTNIVGASEHWKIAGGSRIRRIFRSIVNRDIASLAAGAFRQEGPITVSGVSLGDAILVTLPASFPNSIMVGVPLVSANDTVYLLLHNPSGGAVDPAAADYVFSVIKF